MTGVAVRMGNWKGVKLNFGKNPQAPMQLFNLENDVHEDCDVSEQHPRYRGANGNFHKAGSCEIGPFPLSV